MFNCRHGGLLGCLVVYHCVFVIEASIKCFCNDNACVQSNSTTCIASYACYAEMSNATATYGCIHKVDRTSICVRRGSYSQVLKSKPYLLTCCYRSLCNRHYKGKRWKFLHTRKTFIEKKQREKTSNDVTIPNSLEPLGQVSAKVLSIISAGGLFTLILIIACAVYILCYDERTKITHSALHETHISKPLITHSSSV